MLAQPQQSRQLQQLLPLNLSSTHVMLKATHERKLNHRHTYHYSNARPSPNDLAYTIHLRPHSIRPRNGPLIHPGLGYRSHHVWFRSPWRGSTSEFQPITCRDQPKWRKGAKGDERKRQVSLKRTLARMRLIRVSSGGERMSCF
jgi:hypothetical protein